MSANNFDAVTVAFPDLPPAKAAVVALELEREFEREGVPGAKAARTDEEAINIGGALLIRGGIGGFSFLQDHVMSAVHEVGRQADRHLPAVVRKVILRLCQGQGVRAEVAGPGGRSWSIGEGPAGCAPEPARPTAPTDIEVTISGLKTKILTSSESIPELSGGLLFADRYVVSHKIGEGGMGVVYAAQDNLTGEKVILKLIHPSGTPGEAAIQQLIAEGRTARKIRHPNVVAVYEVGQSNGHPYLTMEYVEGATLRSWMAQSIFREENIMIEPAIAIVRLILCGLEEAHRVGVVHRDLKPENIIIRGEPGDSEFVLKILDFGIAKAIGVHREEESGGGTSLYMAPEQITAPHAVGPAADLYSVTMIFYELLMGLPRGRWQLISEHHKDAPKALDKVIERGLMPLPRNRFQSAKEYIKALDFGDIVHVPPRQELLPPVEVYVNEAISIDNELGKLRRLRALADRGELNAQVELAELYTHGRGALRRDEQEALHLYMRAADQGHPAAQATLGYFYESGFAGLRRDELTAAHLYRLAAAQGDARAQFNLAGFYGKGRGGVRPDIHEAHRLYSLAAEQDKVAANRGDAEAQFRLGLGYAHALGGLRRDEREGVRLFRLAAMQGHAGAQRELGWNYENGRGGLLLDGQEAVRWYTCAANQGDVIAQRLLAFCFKGGDYGLRRDSHEAARLWKLAADGGDAIAQRYLGTLYALGEGGLGRDEKEAARLWRLAADQGEAEAQYLLGNYHASNRDGGPAVMLWKLAAKQGHEGARRNLRPYGVWS